MKSKETEKHEVRLYVLRDTIIAD